LSAIRARIDFEIRNVGSSGLSRVRVAVKFIAEGGSNTKFLEMSILAGRE
jgi:hypothetical protein